MRKSVLDFLRDSGVELGDSRIFEELLKSSSLTRAQAETMLIEAAAARAGRRLTVEEKARIRRVSKGAYARSKRQAIENIKRSIYTLLLLRFLGILGDSAMASILEAAEALARNRVREALSLLEDVTLRDITE